MLLLVIITLVAVAVCVIRVPIGLIPTQLGWMSDQWIAEHRASHAS
jgi:hypothetical protein